MGDLSQTIKGDRLSHISSPVNNDAEFHLRLSEIGMRPKQGQRYFVCFPAECVSDNEPGKSDAGEDVNMARFIQRGTAFIKDAAVDGTHKFTKDKDAGLKSKIGRMYKK